MNSMLVQLDRVFVRPDQVAAIQVLGEQLVLLLVCGQRLPLGDGNLEKAMTYVEQLADSTRHPPGYAGPDAVAYLKHPHARTLHAGG